MFRCDICKAVTLPGIPSRLVTTEVRFVNHPRREVKLTNEKKYYDPGGMGQQIAKQALCCPECYIQVANNPPKKVQ